mgnify:CR=1 FL=1
MSVLISNDAELDTLLDAQEVEHICGVVLAAEGVEREVEISLSYVDEDEMHELNLEWRGIDRTTDVLSFECDSAFDEDIPADETLELGWPRRSLPARRPALATAPPMSAD